MCMPRYAPILVPILEFTWDVIRASKTICESEKGSCGTFITFESQHIEHTLSKVKHGHTI